MLKLPLQTLRRQPIRSARRDAIRVWTKRRLVMVTMLLAEITASAGRRAYELGWLRGRSLARILQLSYRLARFGLRLWRSASRIERLAILRRHFPH